MPWLSLFQWLERLRPAQTEPSSAASALEPRQIPVSSACCHIWTEPSLPLCPETPSTVSTERGRPGPKGFRHPPVISDAWRSQAGRRPDTRAGGRADLCLPENRPKPPSLLSARAAGVGVLGSSRSGGEPPASEWARGCAWPSPTCWAGAVGGALLGWGTSDTRLRRSVLQSSRTQDCPFACNSGKRLQLR